MVAEKNKGDLKVQNLETKKKKRLARKAQQALLDRARMQHVKELTEDALMWFKRGREANLEVGRDLIRIRNILKRIGYGVYFRKTIAPQGITFRTAQNYMAMARKADKFNEKFSSNSAAPADAEDQEMVKAVEKAQAGRASAELAERVKAKREGTNSDGIYQLRLHMTSAERAATNRLCQSPHWPSAERQILEFLRQVRREYGFSDAESLPAA